MTISAHDNRKTASCTYALCVESLPSGVCARGGRGPALCTRGPRASGAFEGLRAGASQGWAHNFSLLASSSGGSAGTAPALPLPAHVGWPLTWGCRVWGSRWRVLTVLAGEGTQLSLKLLGLLDDGCLNSKSTRPRGKVWGSRRGDRALCLQEQQRPGLQP